MYKIPNFFLLIDATYLVCLTDLAMVKVFSQRKFPKSYLLCSPMIRPLNFLMLLPRPSRLIPGPWHVHSSWVLKFNGISFLLLFPSFPRCHGRPRIRLLGEDLQIRKLSIFPAERNFPE